MFEKMKSLMILGSTGSVGLQAADVARAQNYPVRAICANRNTDIVEAQAREFMPYAVAMADPAAASDLKLRLADTDIMVYSGADGICRMIEETDAAVAVNSVLGMSGLMPTISALKSGKQLALANKESLVIAGDIVMSLAKEMNTEIAPVDSEHCAIDQCLRAGARGEIKNILLTASGGPFFGKTRAELAGMTAKEALAHPTWSMGAKITVDSATLMNKGFEFIEAAHLFSVSAEKIKVIVHRESVIHSMVEYCDNSVIAQMSVPDMRLCVQYAIERPIRRQAVIEELDLVKRGHLSFAWPDEETFSPLKLAKKALSAGGACPAVLNAANEVAVAEFLKDRLSFIGIMDALEYTCDRLANACTAVTLDDILGFDSEARRIAAEFCKNKL